MTEWHHQIFNNVFTLIVSFENVSEVNSGFFYKTADEREKLVKAERQFIENRVQKLIDLKKKLCDGTDKSFVVLNQKVFIHNNFLLTYSMAYFMLMHPFVGY